MTATTTACGWIGRAAMTLVDFALPPRCAGCGEIVDDIDGFCPPCWNALDWIGHGGCECCGLPLEASGDLCGRCQAQPLPLDRMRAAVAYGPMSRTIALKLKYGRKVALARTMARYMAPLRDDARKEAILVPIPLHRRRLWWRGFNQAALVARHLARRWAVPVDTALIRRTRATPPLKGMNERQRRDAVRGAFTVEPGRRLDGATIILIDDVLTTGSTAIACAIALRKAGAERIELISWARVVRPGHLVR